MQKHGHLLKKFGAGVINSLAEMYAKAIQEKGTPLENVVGFIDSTKIQICLSCGRGSLLLVTYSGHKYFHFLIYQTVTTSDGLMYYMYGPEVGRWHDMTLYQVSGLGNVLEVVLAISDKQRCLYGDATYLLRPWLQTLFLRLDATEQEIL